MDFSIAKDTYRENAFVQKNMAKSLMFLLEKTCGNSFDKILEIGAGTGFLTKNIISKLKYEELILNDITDNFTQVDVEFIKGDASKIDLPCDCDLIISNAVFQWIDEPCAFFNKIKTNLKNGAVLAFSSFGEQNFKQFKKITQIGLEAFDYEKILKSCGFKVLHFEQEVQTLYFKNPKEVLKHIKATGVSIKRGERWTKSKLENFENMYRKYFVDGNGAELTYHPLYIVASI